VEATVPAKCQSEFWRTLSCKKEATPLKSFLNKWGIFWQLLPLRLEKRKSDVAPRFVPRDSAGYLIITCPKCLRPNKLEAMSLNGGLHQTTCQTCGLPVRFEINHEIEPPMERNDA